VKDVAAIVLAAGRSSRMGACKPLLPFGDSTVIETCIDHLDKAGAEEIVVVLGYRGDEVREQLKQRNLTLAFNAVPDAPMSTSIARGVERVSHTAGCVLISPVDHPAVSSDMITQIIRLWKAGHALVQPEHQGRGGHPVLIDLQYREELQKLDPNHGLRGFFVDHRQEVLRLPVDSPFVAQDMDTWDDYLRLHEAAFGRKPAEFAAPNHVNGRPTTGREASSK
jgi:molybdenum cofactor cytidylyltransferase